MFYRLSKFVFERWCFLVFFFFFNDTATTEIYTLSLHDALPISRRGSTPVMSISMSSMPGCGLAKPSSAQRDRKSTRLNSSHGYISYAVFCLKKKKKKTKIETYKKQKKTNKNKT